MCFISRCMYSFFLSHWRVSCRHDAPFPLNTSENMERGRAHNHSTISKIRKWRLYLIYRSYTNLMKLREISFFPIQEAIRTTHRPSVALNSGRVPQSFFVSMTLPFLKSTGHLFCKIFFNFHLSHICSRLN